MEQRGPLMQTSGCALGPEGMDKVSGPNNLGSPDAQSGSDQDLVRTSVRKRKKLVSSRERLRVYIWLLLLVSVALFATTAFLLYRYIENMLQQRDVCTTADCIRAAATILSTMDIQANPCDDFYQYACGNFHKEHPIPETDFAEDWFTNRNHHVIRKVRDYLVQNDTMEEPRAVRQARVMFRACTDVESLERMSLSPLMAFLEHLGLPKTPPLGDNIVGDWVQAVAHIKRHTDKDIVFGFDVLEDPYNNTINRLSIGMPNDDSPLPSHREHARLRRPSPRLLLAKGSAKVKVAWTRYIIAVLNHVLKYNNESLSEQNKSVKDAAERIMTFEKKLINLKENYTSSDPNKNDLPEYMWVTELQNITDREVAAHSSSQINWRKYLQVLFEDIDEIHLDLTNSDRLAVYNIDYLKALVQLLADTPDSTIMLTVWWELVYELAPHTNKYMRILRSTLEETALGETALASRPTHCAYVVYKLLDVAVGTVDATEDFLYHTTPKVNSMIDDIQESFIAAVDRTTWIDKRTKAAIKDKVSHIKRRIGFPEWILDNEEVDEYYDTLGVEEDKHLENVLTYLGRSVYGNLKTLRTLNDNENSGFNPLEVNAAYSVQDNLILVPLGMLQYPFYNLGLDALNYGAIGSILGHELVHSLDTDGRRYDKMGNYRSWWTNESIASFTQRVGCLVEKYSNYFIEDVDDWVDGNLTLGENIADHGGLRAALWGYHRRVAQRGREPSLPGLQHFSHDQLFFLAFANIWCENYSPESMIHSLHGEHAPNYVRVMATLSDSPEFGKAWNCPVDSEMNPRNKCHVW